jgi:tRNA modification GTPase
MFATSTIAAISTPPGKGGVAVIRISGDSALEIARGMFRPRNAAGFDALIPRKQIYGDILSCGDQLDDGLLTYFPAPNSYTGEDIVEISCHGGVLVTRLVLESAFALGAVPAGRGEFTRRAFINGKLGLTETEAISMLLEAESEAQVKLSREKSRTKMKEATEGIRAALVSILSAVFARIDYPDEDLGDMTQDEVLEAINAVRVDVKTLLSTYKMGRAVALGVPTVICGKPNVGKSTLYNLLVDENAAIVTDIPGTTRDVLEKSISLGRVMLKLWDTAGIREGEVDAVEAIGIERSREKVMSAELVLALFDSSAELDSEDFEILDLLSKSDAVKIALLTKNDKNENNSSQNTAKNLENVKKILADNAFDQILCISAKENGNAAKCALAELVDSLFCDEKLTIGDDAIVSSARQYGALTRADEFLATAAAAIESGLPEDAVSSDVELALGAISELDGRAVSEEVVADIFAKFCVGK